VCRRPTLLPEQYQRWLAEMWDEELAIVTPTSAGTAPPGEVLAVQSEIDNAQRPETLV